MDSTFWMPTYRELRLGLAKILDFRKEVREALNFSEPIEYLNHIHDCDNYALELQADVSRYRFVVAQEKTISVDQLLSWAFGTALCMKVNGRDINHTLNLCITRDAGIVFIEPQDMTMWIADKEKDQPYFVEMR